MGDLGIAAPAFDLGAVLTPGVFAVRAKVLPLTTNEADIDGAY
jgi:hypothetical protein